MDATNAATSRSCRANDAMVAGPPPPRDILRVCEVEGDAPTVRRLSNVDDTEGGVDAAPEGDVAAAATAATLAWNRDRSRDAEDEGALPGIDWVAWGSRGDAVEGVGSAGDGREDGAQDDANGGVGAALLAGDVPTDATERISRRTVSFAATA
jgi:hypothetical protein